MLARVMPEKPRTAAQPTTIRFPAVLLEKAKEQAATERRSFAAYLSILIEEDLRRNREAKENIPIEHATILWNAADQDGRILVIDERRDRGQYDRLFAYSAGAAFSYWEEMNDMKRLLTMFAKAFELMLAYNLPPRDVAKAFSVVKEFREALGKTEWERMGLGKPA